MSAPNTNIEKQKSRHRPVLIGIAAVVIFALVVFYLNVGTGLDGEGPIIEPMIEDDAQMIEPEEGS